MIRKLKFQSQLHKKNQEIKGKVAKLDSLKQQHGEEVAELVQLHRQKEKEMEARTAELQEALERKEAEMTSDGS